MKLQVFLAKKADPFAVREVLDRTIGRAVGIDTIIAMESRSPGAAGPAFATLTSEQINEEIRSMHESIPAPPRMLPAPSSSASDFSSDVA